MFHYFMKRCFVIWSKNIVLQMMLSTLSNCTKVRLIMTEFHTKKKKLKKKKLKKK